MYLNLRSCFKSRMRSRNAHSMSSMRFSGIVDRVSAWSGVSITTSWAPTPFILSNIPSACRSRSPSIPNAGNLLGTTRRFQPVVSRLGFSPGRYASISGGVVLSLPGQNGQNPPFRVTRSREKSPGRLERSVEIITHRPVTGSFLSSVTAIILQPALGPRFRASARETKIHAEIVDSRTAAGPGYFLAKNNCKQHRRILVAGLSYPLKANSMRPTRTTPELEQLYSQHGPALLLFAAAITGERSRAQDVLHQVFLKLLEDQHLRRAADVKA